MYIKYCNECNLTTLHGSYIYTIGNGLLLIIGLITIQLYLNIIV